MDAKGRSFNQWLLYHEATHPDDIYLRQPRKGIWHELTWREVMQQARKVAAFLHQSGLSRGDRVAIYSKNCAEWFISDFAISLAGLVSVPLFANQHEDSIHFVLRHADVKLVFVGKLDHFAKLRSYIPDNLRTVSFDYHEPIADKNDISWQEILRKYPPLMELVEPDPSALFTIIYSSGTSGLPKGAVYTHEIIREYLQLYPLDIARIRKLDFYNLVSYLPLAHVYERTAIELGSVTIPCTISFIESLDRFAENLREIKPVLFTAVPRIWGVFQQKIEQKLPEKRLNLLLKIPFLSRLIKKKIRKQLGLDRCLNCFSGASHLPVAINQFFDRLDIPIQEGYGQTENLAYATFSLLSERKPGYVGTPRLGVEIKLGENEELLMKSPCLMKEYFHDPEATLRVLTNDQWLKTGDFAEIDAAKRIKILGRLSENFKNQKGEFISPGPIEEKFYDNPFIEQLCMIGRELPNNVLVVILSEQTLREPRAKVKKSLEIDLHRINSRLANFEKISHIIIADIPWTVENGYLTPTLKIKRRVVETEYLPLIQKAIKDRPSIIWESDFK